MNLNLKTVVVIYKSLLFFLTALFYLFLFMMLFNLYSLLVNDIRFFEDLTDKTFPYKINDIWNRKEEFLWIIAYTIRDLIIITVIKFLVHRIPFYESIQEWEDNQEINQYLKVELQDFFFLNKKINLRDLSYLYSFSQRKDKMFKYHMKQEKINRFLLNQKFSVKSVDKKEDL